LHRQFAEALKQILLDDELVEWLKTALRQSLDIETAHYLEAVESLTAQLDQIRCFKHKVFEEHVEGLVDKAMFTELINRYRTEEQRLSTLLLTHRNADTKYIEYGAKMLELVQHAGTIYESTNSVGKNKMLKILCSNCTLLDGVLTVTYREPFVLFADFARQVQKKERVPISRNPIVTLNGVDGTRIAIFDHPQ